MGQKKAQKIIDQYNLTHSLLENGVPAAIPINSNSHIQILHAEADGNPQVSMVKNMAHHNWVVNGKKFINMQTLNSDLDSARNPGMEDLLQDIREKKKFEERKAASGKKSPLKFSNLDEGGDTPEIG